SDEERAQRIAGVLAGALGRWFLEAARRAPTRSSDDGVEREDLDVVIVLTRAAPKLGERHADRMFGGGVDAKSHRRERWVRPAAGIVVIEAHEGNVFGHSDFACRELFEGPEGSLVVD